jgi:hypothetical protein
MIMRPRFVLVALLAGTPLAGTTAAMADEAACKAVGDAVVKMAETPARETVVIDRPPTTIKSEVVKTADRMYVQVRGQWHSMPYDSRKEAIEARDKMKLSEAACSKEGRQDVDGEATDLYKVHTAVDGHSTDMQLWIAVASGLPIKVESFTVESKMKSEIHLAYDKVVPPAGVP